MKVEIPIGENIVLTDIREGDKALFVSYLSDPKVGETLSGLPDPYTEESAVYWIQDNREKLANGRTHHFAIRDGSGLLLGCCGYHDWDGHSKTHKSAIGYWIGRPYWGKGIATHVVKALVQYGFDRLNLVRLSAYVFEGNSASIRVLEKAGFRKEGVARKEFLKGGKYLDGVLYGITKGDSHP